MGTALSCSDWKKTVTVSWFCCGVPRAVHTTELSGPRQTGQDRVRCHGSVLIDELFFQGFAFLTTHCRHPFNLFFETICFSKKCVLCYCAWTFCMMFRTHKLKHRYTNVYVRTHTLSLCLCLSSPALPHTYT